MICQAKQVLAAFLYRAKKPRQRNIPESEATVYGQYLELPVGSASVPKPGGAGELGGVSET